MTGHPFSHNTPSAPHGVGPRLNPPTPPPLPGAPPLASYLPLHPPATWLKRHSHSPTHRVRKSFPGVGWRWLRYHFSASYGIFFKRIPSFPPVTGNKGRCQELCRHPLRYPPYLLQPPSHPSRSPATWLNGNPTSQDLKSHPHGSVSIHNRTPLAPSRPGTDRPLPAHLSSVTYRYQEGRWRRRWRRRRWWCSQSGAKPIYRL